MINLRKYRKLSVFAIIILVIMWLSAIAMFWNLILNTEVKNEGWVLLFMTVEFLAGLALFYFAFFAADPVKLETLQQQAFESGKSETIQEYERKKEAEKEIQVDEEALKRTADAVLSGINLVRSENGFCSKLLSGLAREMSFVQGVIYIKDGKKAIYRPAGEYAITDRKPEAFEEGETLASQAISAESIIVIHDIPQDYFKISSGLGNASPGYLLLAPVKVNNETIAVLELASFKKPETATVKTLDIILSQAGPKLNKFIASQS